MWVGARFVIKNRDEGSRRGHVLRKQIAAERNDVGDGIHSSPSHRRDRSQGPEQCRSLLALIMPKL
jgi:hypothetical protein